MAPVQSKMISWFTPTTRKRSSGSDTESTPQTKVTRTSLKSFTSTNQSKPTPYSPETPIDQKKSPLAQSTTSTKLSTTTLHEERDRSESEVVSEQQDQSINDDTDSDVYLDEEDDYNDDQHSDRAENDDNDDLSLLQEFAIPEIAIERVLEITEQLGIVIDIVDEGSDALFAPLENSQTEKDTQNVQPFTAKEREERERSLIETLLWDSNLPSQNLQNPTPQ